MIHSFFSSTAATSTYLYLVKQSDQVVKLLTKSLRSFGASAIGSLIYFIVSISLMVTVLSSKVSKSMVKAYGIPHSSVLAYLLPTVWPESSNLELIPAAVSKVLSS